MAYNPAIPQPTDRISDSQAPILANFIALDAAILVDHVALNAVGQGKHKQITLPESAAAPVTGANEAVVYSREGAFSGQTELVFKREGNPATVTEMTSAGSGWTMLPSGVLIKFGSSSPATGLTTITYGVGPSLPVFKAGSPFNVFVSPVESTAGDVNVAVRLVSYSTTDIVVYVSKRYNSGAAATPTKINFFALGLPA